MGALKDTLYLGTQTKFCTICYMFRPPWIKFGPGDEHKNLLGDCELRENVCSERHTLLKGVHEFLSVLSTSTVHLYVSTNIDARKAENLLQA
jgi:hypothetical protein